MQHDLNIPISHLDLTPFVEKARAYGLQGISVWQEDKEIGRYTLPNLPSSNIYSGSKSILSAAVGFAVSEGLLSLEEKVVDAFPEECPKYPIGPLEEMKLKHLLTMSLGFPRPLLMGGEHREDLRRTVTDWVRYCLKDPVIHTPGSTFHYNNAGPYLLGVLIQRRSQMSLMDYLKPRLLTPLGITITKWEQDPMGYDFAAGGFHMTLDDFAAFGRLYLQEGNWNGKRLLDEAWINASKTPHMQVRGDDEIGDGYGYLFWTLPDGGYRADGKHEQYCLILPEKEAVVAIFSKNYDETSDHPILRLALREVTAKL